jgi:hypothetical protein
LVHSRQWGPSRWAFRLTCKCVSALCRNSENRRWLVYLRNEENHSQGYEWQACD